MELTRCKDNRRRQGQRATRTHPTNFRPAVHQGGDERPGAAPSRAGIEGGLPLGRAGARPSADCPWPGRPRGNRRGASGGHPRRRTGPDALAFYISGQMSLEAQYLVNKLAKGYVRTNNIDSNSRLCMSSAADRLQAVPRRRRATGLLPGHGPRRPVPGDRRQHGRLPPHPVPARARPGEGGRQDDRGGSAPQPHGRQGGPVPPGEGRHRRGVAERTAAPALRGGRLRRRARSSPPTPRAGTGLRAFHRRFTPRPRWPPSPAFAESRPPPRRAP